MVNKPDVAVPAALTILDLVDASESRGTIRDRCFGKDKEKAKMLKTLAGLAGDASLWGAELAPSFW